MVRRMPSCFYFGADPIKIKSRQLFVRLISAFIARNFLRFILKILDPEKILDQQFRMACSISIKFNNDFEFT
jgi:hypothetical protein